MKNDNNRTTLVDLNKYRIAKRNQASNKVKFEDMDDLMIHRYFTKISFIAAYLMLFITFLLHCHPLSAFVLTNAIMFSIKPVRRFFRHQNQQTVNPPAPIFRETVRNAPTISQHSMPHRKGSVIPFLPKPHTVEETIELEVHED